jgi:hypothetical protein
MTYPTVVRLGTHYLGAGSDMWIFHWNDWWLRECLLEWRNPFYTTSMFYPEGVSLVYHNFAWLNTIAWLPLSQIVGPIAAYNVIFILNLALGGLGAYALARYLVRNRWIAFLAGLVFCFWPFRMQHFNRPNMISTGWIPLFLLYLIRTIDEGGRWRDGLLAGLFLGLTGLSRWLHLALAGAMAALYLAHSLICERQKWEKRTFAALALAGLTAALILAPFAAPVALAQSRGGGDVEGVYLDRSSLGTDLLGHFVPARGHPVFHQWLVDLWARMGQESFIGYTVLALAAYGVVRNHRRSLFWLVLAGLIAALSLGTRLRVGGQVYHVPMPYRLIQSTFFGGLVRAPRRLGIVLGLPAAVLVAYGAKEASRSLMRRWGGRFTRILAVLAGGLVLFEYLLWPYPTVQPRISPFYEQLAQEAGDFGLLELPMGASTPAKIYMYYATLHGKSLVEGHVSRLPADAYRFIDGVPLTRSLHETNRIPPDLDDVSRQLGALADAGVRYVILHKDLARLEQVDGWMDWLALAPIYEDDLIVVYNTDLQHGRDYRLAGEVGDGVGVIEADLSAGALPQDGLLQVEVVWGTSRPPGRDWVAYLALVGSEGEEVQRAAFEPCSDWPTSSWDSDAVARGRGVLQIDPFVRGGPYTVTVGLSAPDTGVDAGGPLPVGRVEVQAVERVFAVPAMEEKSGAVFGTALRLLGYDLETAEEHVALTLHWKALRRMDVSSKFFLHLYDVESGTLAAQTDVIPRGWSYPTVWWESGEVVSDRVSLSLDGVAAGRYHLAVGVYNSETGERLPVSISDESVVLARALVLREMMVP